MWKCEKCGREYKNQNQHHYCNDPDNSIDAYIANQPEEVQVKLKQLRDTLRSALPEAEERISWKMPTYWKKHNIIHFAAHKHHIGLYPGDKAMEQFKDRLKEYRTSKGALQLPYSEPLPLELITEIALWCLDNMDKMHKKI